MELYELKERVLNNTLSDQFIILQCEKDYFLAEQYLKKLCENNNTNIRLIESLDSLLTATASLFAEDNLEVIVYKTDEFNDYFEDYTKFNNCIVLCNKVDKKIMDKVSDYIVKVSAPTEWQVKAYITTKCPGLDSGGTDWLFNTVGNNLYKLTNELNKIALFDSKDQLKVLAALKYETGSDLYNKTLLQLGNDIVNGDKIKLLDYLYHQNICDFEALSLVGLLLKSYKKAYLIRYRSGLTLAELEVSESQYKYLASHTTQSEDFLLKVIEFLSAIDYRLKSGQLDLSNTELINYIITKILSFES